MVCQIGENMTTKRYFIENAFYLVVDGGWHVNSLLILGQDNLFLLFCSCIYIYIKLNTK